MRRSTHLVVDCRDVSRDVCLDDAVMLNVMAWAAGRAGATVISQMRYRFGHDSPPGFAALLMLDESHCSAHTYADSGQIALDVFTCGAVDCHELLVHIRERIDLGTVTVREIERFVGAERAAAARGTA